MQRIRPSTQIKISAHRVHSRFPPLTYPNQTRPAPLGSHSLGEGSSLHLPAVSARSKSNRFLGSSVPPFLCLPPQNLLASPLNRQLERI